MINGQLFTVSNDQPAPAIESDKFGFKISKDTQDKLRAQREKIDAECNDTNRLKLQKDYYELLSQAYEESKAAQISDPRLKDVIQKLKEVNDALDDTSIKGKKRRDLEQQKENLEEQKKVILQLIENEKSLKDEDNPREKTKLNKVIRDLNTQLDDLKKKYIELAGAPPPPSIEDQIKDLEERIQFEKNLSKRQQLEKELETLKALPKK
jgi:hypothetical protein